MPNLSVLVLYPKARSPSENLMKPMDLLRKELCMARILKFPVSRALRNSFFIVLLYKYKN